MCQNLHTKLLCSTKSSPWGFLWTLLPCSLTITSLCSYICPIQIGFTKESQKTVYMAGVAKMTYLSRKLANMRCLSWKFANVRFLSQNFAIARSTKGFVGLFARMAANFCHPENNITHHNRLSAASGKFLFDQCNVALENHLQRHTLLVLLF